MLFGSYETNSHTLTTPPQPRHATYSTLATQPTPQHPGHAFNHRTLTALAIQRQERTGPLSALFGCC